MSPQTSFLWLGIADGRLHHAFWFSFPDSYANCAFSALREHTPPLRGTIVRDVPGFIGSNPPSQPALSAPSARDWEPYDKGCRETLCAWDRRSRPVGKHAFAVICLPKDQKPSSSLDAFRLIKPKARLHHCAAAVKWVCRLGRIPLPIAASMEHGILQKVPLCYLRTAAPQRASVRFFDFSSAAELELLLQSPLEQITSSFRLNQGPSKPILQERRAHYGTITTHFKSFGSSRDPNGRHQSFCKSGTAACLRVPHMEVSASFSVNTVSPSVPSVLRKRVRLSGCSRGTVSSARPASPRADPILLASADAGRFRTGKIRSA